MYPQTLHLWSLPVIRMLAPFRGRMLSLALRMNRQSTNWVKHPVIIKWELEGSAAAKCNTLPRLGLLGRVASLLADGMARSVRMTLLWWIGVSVWSPQVIRTPSACSSHRTSSGGTPSVLPSRRIEAAKLAP